MKNEQFYVMHGFIRGASCQVVSYPQSYPQLMGKTLVSFIIRALTTEFYSA